MRTGSIDTAGGPARKRTPARVPVVYRRPGLDAARRGAPKMRAGGRQRMPPACRAV